MFSSHSRRRLITRALSLLATLCLAFGVSAAAIAPAQAASGITRKTLTTSYSRSSSFHSSPLGLCVHAYLTGGMSATYIYQPAQSYPVGTVAYQSLINPTLNQPKLKVVVTKSCAGGSARKKVGKATLTQSFYYYSCSANPSISAGAPWSVGVSVTPTCGNHRTAHRSTTYGADKSSYAQYNSGYHATFKKLVSGPASTKVSACLHGYANVTVYRGNRSDSGRLDMGNICFTV